MFSFIYIFNLLNFSYIPNPINTKLYNILEGLSKNTYDFAKEGLSKWS
ncbi:hypothetical protein MTBPR1_170027 [Candidatus Terasakiella magnetica]|uniref:Uncharacterized protein n=1 Tax=Candidatus Terasakiella magnetica TaxID=1867952 RepID=A0A1C3RFQ2_9PROT|nr:hypothetical protein MTBPR1_170027 [Candidatus Terasakiella magnetica]